MSGPGSLTNGHFFNNNIKNIDSCLSEQPGIAPFTIKARFGFSLPAAGSPYKPEPYIREIQIRKNLVNMSGII